MYQEVECKSAMSTNCVSEIWSQMKCYKLTKNLTLPTMSNMDPKKSWCKGSHEQLLFSVDASCIIVFTGSVLMP